MAIELKVPAAGESITEVVVSEWLKDEGTIADRDEALAVIETDKANLEVVAPTRGRLLRILKNAGEAARVGEVIGLLEEVQEGTPSRDQASSDGGAAQQDRAPRSDDGRAP